MDRTIVLDALMRSEPFRHASVRVLDRILDGAVQGTAPAAGGDAERRPVLDSDLAFLLATGGPLRIREAPVPEMFTPPARGDAGEALEPWRGLEVQPRLEVVGRNEVAFRRDLGSGSRTVESLDGRPRTFHYVTRTSLAAIASTSVALLGIERAEQFEAPPPPLAPTDEIVDIEPPPPPPPEPRAVRVCISGDAAARRGVPLLPIAEILAWSYQRYFHPERTALAVLDGQRVRLFAWDPKSSARFEITVPGADGTDQPDVNTIEHAARATFPGLSILFVVDPSGHGGRLRTLVGLGGFDKLLYLSSALPDRLPGHLTELVSKEGEIVPSILIDRPRRDAADPDGVRWARALRVPRQAGLLSSNDSIAELHRNACRLRIDRVMVDRTWQNGRPTGSFDSGLRATFERWARRVADKQVGLALCGGGALCYRLVPLLRRLHGQIPIDVVSGVSGGALLGAYYCSFALDGRGAEGLDAYVEGGVRFARAMRQAFFWSGVIQDLIDGDLGSVRLEELEMRFAPLATALPQRSAPYPIVFERATLGQAVCGSGSLPLLVAPTTFRDGGRAQDGRRSSAAVRVTDGGLTTSVPGRVLPDEGADFTIALNAVPGPMDRAIFGHGTVADCLYDLPGMQRVVDLVTGLHYFLYRSADVERLATRVFIDSSPEHSMRLLEMIAFDQAAAIVEGEEQSKPMLDEKADQCVKMWETCKASGPKTSS